MRILFVRGDYFSRREEEYRYFFWVRLFKMNVNNVDLNNVKYFSKSIRSLYYVVSISFFYCYVMLFY